MRDPIVIDPHLGRRQRSKRAGKEDDADDRDQAAANRERVASVAAGTEDLAVALAHGLKALIAAAHLAHGLASVSHGCRRVGIVATMRYKWDERMAGV